MAQQFTITRRLEIDAAHRVPDHQSKCFNIHGHRYVIEATCAGDIIEAGEQKGMVMDFGFLKECMVKAIHDPCDHGAIFYKRDPMLEGIEAGVATGWKLFIIDCVPTAENLAKIWHEAVEQEIRRFFDSRLMSNRTPELIGLTVWETPNCKAQYPW